MDEGDIIYDTISDINRKEETYMSEVIVNQGIVDLVKFNDQYKLYSFKVGDTYYGAGKYEPKFAEGDEIKFGASQNGKGYWNLEFGTVEVLEKGKGKVQGNVVNTSQASSKATDWDAKDKRITYLACRNSALTLITAAVTSDSIVLPTKKSDRLEALDLLVSEKTDEYYEDIYGNHFKQEESPS